jgi:hypothetical protein
MVIEIKRISGNRWHVFRVHRISNEREDLGEFDGSIAEIGQKLSERFKERVELRPCYGSTYHYSGKPRRWNHNVFRGGVL